MFNIGDRVTWTRTKRTRDGYSLSSFEGVITFISQAAGVCTVKRKGKSSWKHLCDLRKAGERNELTDIVMSMAKKQEGGA